MGCSSAKSSSLALFAATLLLAFEAEEILGFEFKAERSLGFGSEGVLWFRTADLSEDFGFFLGEGGSKGFSAAGRVLTCSCSESDEEAEVVFEEEY